MDRFAAAMNNDLDVAGALGVLFDLVREGNSRRDAGEAADGLVSAYDQIVEVLGLATVATQVDDSDAVEELGDRFGIALATIDDLVAFRSKARQDRDWATSDAIRDGLSELPITIEDTSDGTLWHRD